MIKINNVPTGYQKDFDGANVFVLLHMLIENEEYRNFYTDSNHKFDLIILDNSAFELGKSMDSVLLIRWALILKETHPEAVVEIIIPDVYGNKDKTLESLYDFISRWDLTGFKLMAVPQGENIEELTDCLSDMLSYFPEVDTIGINKLWDESCWEYVFKKITYYGKEIHKLGVNNLKDWTNPSLNLVRSADSRILSKLVTGKEDPWDSKLDETQIKILKNLFDEVKKW